MTNFDFNADDAYVPTEDDFAELYASVTAGDDDNSYNLVADADQDCLNGYCDHFCGEPTQADLDRLERRGFGHLVEAYENNLHYV